MSEIKKVVQKIKDNPKYVVIIGLCGIVLIFMSGFFGDKQKSEAVPTNSITAQQYIEQLEKRLAETIQNVAGGEISVVITADSGIEYVYASEKKSDSSEVENVESSQKSKLQKDGSSENGYVIVKDSDGNELPLVVTEIMPKIKGVVVSCQSVGSNELKQDIITIVATALDILPDRICIVCSEG